MTDPTRDDESSGSRRRFLGAAAAVATAAWAAPAIISVDAAAAATGPGGSGSVSGTVRVCEHEIDPGDSWKVSVSGPGTGSTVANTTTGAYSITGLPDGTYDVTLTPPWGIPVQPYPAAFTITGGGAAFFDPDYTYGGC